MRTVLVVIGVACFIFIPILTLSYLGFGERFLYQTYFISNRSAMCFTGALLGMIGALLIDKDLWKASVPAGCIAGLSMVGFTLFYVGDRERFYLQEYLILFVIGFIPGVLTYITLSEGQERPQKSESLGSTGMLNNTRNIVHYDEYEEVS